jgi:hypothetical protein
MSNYRTIAESDIGKSTIEAFGRRWPVSGFIGQILPQDVGKRIYLSGDILQVENDEQMKSRLEQKEHLRKALEDGIRRKVGEKMASKIKVDII